MSEHKQKSEAAQRYREAGVDLDSGYEVVRQIQKDVASTERPGSLPSMGRFGGLFDLSSLGYKEPVLVSGTDGVGTKLMLAFEMNRHDTIGIDAVAMCVNDVLVQGAEPLYFLDYVALPKVEPAKVAAIVSGIAAGCRETNCALIGGETAEMNGLYAPGHYDIAGFAVGVAEKSRLITGEKLKEGDVLLGLPSSGCHSNGFSLLRKIFFKDHAYTMDSTFPKLEKPLGETLLTPTRLYVKPILALLKEVEPHAMCHITGGGFYENIPRMSDQNFNYSIQKGTWPIPPIFKVVQQVSGMTEPELFNIFNMGIGFMIALDPKDVASAQETLKKAGQDSYIVGRVEAGEGVTFHE